MDSYSAKILLAWGEAISGNTKLRDWLIKNGFPELGLFCFALRNKDDARNWLLENGHPHLMALVNGAEGNMTAVAWLMKNNYELLGQMAMAADNDEAAMRWIHLNTSKEMFLIAQKIQFVKNRIDADNEDAHRFSKD
jgi:hypothetical protein